MRRRRVPTPSAARRGGVRPRRGPVPGDNKRLPARARDMQPGAATWPPPPRDRDRHGAWSRGPPARSRDPVLSRARARDNCATTAVTGPTPTTRRTTRGPGRTRPPARETHASRAHARDDSYAMMAVTLPTPRRDGQRGAWMRGSCSSARRRAAARASRRGGSRRRRGRRRRSPTRTPARPAGAAAAASPGSSCPLGASASRARSSPHASPSRLAVAVAAVDPLRAALAVVGTADRVSVRAHQRLRHLLHHRPQQIRARLLERLAQPVRHVHRVLDHRAPPPACL